MSARQYAAGLFCLLVMLAFIPAARAQRLSDSNHSKTQDSVGNPPKHSPSKATIYSAILPGLGQAYNKKYWKIPVIYAGLGTLGYFVQSNGRETKLIQETLNARVANDSSSAAFYRYPTRSVTILKSDRNYYRKYRDYSILGFVLLYAINIVDAAVDAHLYDFNVDKPLSQRKERHWHLYTDRVGTIPTYGISYSF